MITVTAKSEGGYTNVSTKVEADSIAYMDEVLAIIKSLMKGLRENDVLMHAAVLQTLAEHPSILLGKGEDADEKKDKSILERLKIQKERAN